MSKQVLFNGTVLVRAGGATRVDASAFQNVGLGGVGSVGLVGEAEGGQPNVVLQFNSPQDMVQYFKSGALADAADLVFRPLNDVRVPGGAQTVYAVKVNQATQSTKVLNKSASPAMTVTSIDYGSHTNKITVEVATSGGGKTIEFTYEDGITKLTETSPVLGAAAEFTVIYAGLGSAATMTVTDTQITTAITGAAGDNLTIPFSTYKTLQEVINYINQAAAGVYTAVAITNNPYTFDPANLDRVTAVNILSPATGSFKAVLYRMIEWVNSHSSLVTATRATAPNGVGAPDDLALSLLASGSRGSSTNTNWQDGFDLLGTVRVNETVPLASQDLSAEGHGSTATIASIVSMSDAHAAYYSSTAGKNERQNYVGIKGSKSAFLAVAGALQSAHTILTAQVVTRNDAASNLVAFQEWGYACMLAGGRAGSILGEPLTWKILRASGLSQDSSWNPLDDGADIILGGGTFAFQVPGGGYKSDRVITTYTKDDNAAYAEESIITCWKSISYDLRKQLEDIYTGVRGLPATVRGIADTAGRILEKFRQEGQIVDSILQDGTVLKAYRDLKVVLTGDVANLSVIVSPVSGINFQLNTMFLVPATVAA